MNEHEPRGSCFNFNQSSRLNGNIFRILVAIGDTVKKGTPLLIVEAMKMEHEILAPIDGIIEKINIEVGEQVSTDMELVSIKELDK